jgi:hypothetical protein
MIPDGNAAWAGHPADQTTQMHRLLGELARQSGPVRIVDLDGLAWSRARLVLTFNRQLYTLAEDQTAAGRQARQPIDAPQA